MSHKTKIFFHASPPVYSGHEAMLVLIIKALAESNMYEINVVTSIQCTRLVSELSRHCNFIYCHGINQSIELFSILSISGLRKAWSFFLFCKRYKPDKLYFSQGDIEHASIPILIANLMRIPSISYLPLFYKKQSIGARLGLFRDILASLSFTRASSYITINTYQSQLCFERFNHTPRLLQNYVEPPLFSYSNESNLSCDSQYLSICIPARISFKHKGQDLLISYISQFIDELSAIARFHFYGDGVDSQKLTSLIKTHNVSHFVFYHGHGHANDIYKHHCLLLPSLFEGTPLVLIEAYLHNLFAIVNDIPSLRPIVSSSYRYDTAHSLYEIITSVYHQFRSSKSSHQSNYNQSYMNALTSYSSFVNNVFSVFQ